MAKQRAAIYLRVSTTDRQTTENQRIALAGVAERRGWVIVQTYEDKGISGAKGRDKRPAFDQMLKDAVRRKFDICMVWSIDRLGRSVLHVANAIAELDAASVALYSDQQAIDSTTPFGLSDSYFAIEPPSPFMIPFSKEGELSGEASVIKAPTNRALWRFCMTLRAVPKAWGKHLVSFLLLAPVPLTLTIPASAQTTLASGLVNPGNLVLDNQTLVFTSGTSIDSIPVTGGSVISLATMSRIDSYGITRGPGDLLADGNTIYGDFGNYDNNPIYSLPIGGGTPTFIADNSGGYLTAVNQGKLYYGSGFRSINSIPISGGSPTPVATGYWIRGSAENNGNLFFQSYASPNLYDLNLFNQKITTIASGLYLDSGIKADSQNLYISNDKSIMSVPKTGGTPIELVGGSGLGLATAYGGFAYFTSGNTIQRVSAFGGTPQLLETLPAGTVAGSMSTDGSTLYYATSSGKIDSLDLGVLTDQHSLGTRITYFQDQIDRPIVDLRSAAWDDSFVSRIATGAVTSISNLFADLTGHAAQDYTAQIDAAYSFNNAARIAIQNASNLYQTGDERGAQRWVEAALSELTRQNDSVNAAISIANGDLGTAYDIANVVYQADKLAWTATCGVLGSAAAACMGVGDQIYTITDGLIDTAKLGIAPAVQNAISNEITNFILGKLSLDQTTLSGEASLGDTIKQVVNSPDFMSQLRDSLVNAGYGGVIDQIDLPGMLTSVENGLANFSYDSAAQANVQSQSAANTGAADLGGQTLSTGTDQLVNTGSISGSGAIQTRGLVNLGNVVTSGGNLSVSGDVYNAGEISISGASATFTGNVTDSGKLTVDSSTASFAKPLQLQGEYLSDPSSSYFSDIYIGQSGYLVGGARDLFSVSGSMFSCSSQDGLWNTSLATLAFTGTGDHAFDLTGRNVGPSMSGFDKNFSWGTLDLSGLSGIVELQNSCSPSDNALYVHHLAGAVVDGEVIQNISSGGLDVYYVPGDPGNAYLRDGLYTLQGGGYLIPINAVPEPDSLWIICSGIFPLLLISFLRNRGNCGLYCPPRR